MDETLRRLNFCFIYIYDILADFSSEKEYLEHLQALISWLNDKGILINRLKCIFGDPD